MDYNALLRMILGNDSGWRVFTPPATELSIGIPDWGNLEYLTLGLRSSAGRSFNCNLFQGSVGLSIGIQSAGKDTAQRLLPRLKNKILTGPMGRERVTESDIEGFYGSLSLGISTEDSENLTVIWFGDWASTISTLLTPSGYPAFLAQMGFATAVAIIPSGSSGCTLSRGYCGMGARTRSRGVAQAGPGVSEL